MWKETEPSHGQLFWAELLIGASVELQFTFFEASTKVIPGHPSLHHDPLSRTAATIGWELRWL